VDENTDASIQLKWTPYIKQDPFLAQIAFLSLADLEALYGGATKGGKTSALLMAQLQYVDVPNYAGLFLRKTSAPLMMPDGALARAHDWLHGTDARWNQDLMTYFFPSGSQIVFGFLEHSTDRQRYQGPNFQTITPDELTQFELDDYLWMFSRMSRPAGSSIPLRMRGGTNPPEDDRGEWVYERFLVPGAHVDHEATDMALRKLGAVRYAQLRKGDWNAKRSTDFFMMDRLKTLYMRPRHVLGRIRYWDKAHTEGGKGAGTCGILMSRVDPALYGVAYVIEHMVFGRWSWQKRNQIMLETAETDPFGTTIWIEQEPAGGKEGAEISKLDLSAFDVHTETARMDKIVRARPLAAAIENDEVAVVSDGTWDVASYRQYLGWFPKGPIKDPIDGTSGAYNHLAMKQYGPAPRLGKPRPQYQLPGGFALPGNVIFPNYRSK
jgi:phage terminase large subunit-like protein